MTGKVGYSVY